MVSAVIADFIGVGFDDAQQLAQVCGGDVGMSGTMPVPSDRVR